MKNNYKVTYTNWKNIETEITIIAAESEKDAWNRADEAKKKYLSDAEKAELGQVTKITLSL